MTTPVGPYTPIVRTGDWLVTSGQIGLRDGTLVTGGVDGAFNQVHRCRQRPRAPKPGAIDAAQDPQPQPRIACRQARPGLLQKALQTLQIGAVAQRRQQQ